MDTTKAKHKIKYSLVVASFNRLDELKELFPSLDAQIFDLSLVEVIIVDDGSNDGTDTFVKQYKAPYDINYYHQANQGPGAARNLGMKMSNGDYILFTDSDCIWPPDYLSKVDANLSVSDYDAFGGPDSFHPDFSDLLKAINYAMTSFLGTGGTRGSKKSVAKFYPRSFNMGIKQEVFQRIGGFGDLRHGQDMDFSARIYQAGFRVGLIDNATVFHKRRTSFKKFFKQIFNWGVARINLTRMHEGFLKPVHLLPAGILIGGIMVLLLSPFMPILAIFRSIFIAGAIFIGLLAFIQSFFQHFSLRISLLSVLALFIQVAAYGLGTLSGLIQWLLGKSSAKGFTKNYYK